MQYQRFNIVDPERDDFALRAVSSKEDEGRSDEERIALANQLRTMIEKRGVVHDDPLPTKSHTIEELKEMGFVCVTFYDYPELKDRP